MGEVGRMVAFGAICGSLTGFSMGMVDTFNAVRQNPSKMDVKAVTRLTFHEMGKSGAVVAAFFSLYQAVKCGVRRVTTDTLTVVTTTTTISLLPLSVFPPLRRYVPFGLTLVAVDTYHTYYTRRPE